jgi:hypothetical protein
MGVERHSQTSGATLVICRPGLLQTSNDSPSNNLNPPRQFLQSSLCLGSWLLECSQLSSRRRSRSSSGSSHTTSQTAHLWLAGWLAGCLAVYSTSTSDHSAGIYSDLLRGPFPAGLGLDLGFCAAHELGPAAASAPLVADEVLENTAGK